VVAFMALIDTVNGASLIYMVWWYCVTNYGNPESLLYTLWPYPFAVIANAIIAPLTQIFLGYRLRRLTQSNLLFGVISVVAVVDLALGIMIGVRYGVQQDANDVKGQLTAIDTICTYWLGLQSGLDLLITGIMVFCLHKSRTHFQQMNRVLVRLTAVAIQTGTFCTIFAMGDLFSFREMPETNLWGVFAFPIGRIYTNTLMLTLNMREELRDMLGEPRMTNFRIDTSQLHNGPTEDLPILNASTSLTGETRSSHKPPKSIAQMPPSGEPTLNFAKHTKS